MNTTKGPKGLREEWSLLLHSFLNEDPDHQTEKQKLVDKMKSAELTLDEIKIIKKELSSKRKKMNQSIEKIKIKIEQVNNVIENLRLVGSDSTGLVKEIDFLSHEGEKISEEVMDLDQKIKKLHELQDMVSA
ncbi:MAG: hypothetical protein K0R29_2887 [Pseudobdellovibrio sp.]|jgi:methyl-accepting chemotaxis protein|nr:hypothetical protein [Pseudobdellovibrio sp.]